MPTDSLGLILLMAAGVIAGMLAGWPLLSFLDRRRRGSAASLATVEADILEKLPDLLGRMLTSTSRRGIALLALGLVEQILHPEIFMLFAARPAQRRLALVAGMGLPSSLLPGFEVSYGQGWIGLVAETRTTMDASDFERAAGLLSEPHSRPDLAELPIDLVAPIEDDAGLAGVLCVGGARRNVGREKRVLKLVADITALAMTYVRRLREAEDSAAVDNLTGVHNKHYFQKRFTDELRWAERDQVPVSLLFLDIDNFKHYNDTNGHVAGDDVLKKVGQIIKGSVREEDVIARYGGEEFIVLFRGASKELAYRLGEALRLAVESHPFPHRGTQPLGAVTISGGVATYPQDSRNGMDLIRQADQALYEAKAGGRNRILMAQTPDEQRERPGG
jgi:diguanylate cyclase (GGDEF)-like protein